MRFLMILLLWLSPISASFQSSPAFQLTGTAINLTDPQNPMAAPVQIVVRGDGCNLTVSPPLSGSGLCSIKSFDSGSGSIELVSYGPPMIVWTGKIKGNLVSGSYKIDIGNQKGTFYLALLRAVQDEPPQAPKQSAPTTRTYRGKCSPAIESAISGEIHGWDGETIFKLDNGQIWQQAEYDYTYFYEYHPDVTIYETSAGCRMKVEDEEETVLVKRIK